MNRRAVFALLLFVGTIALWLAARPKPEPSQPAVAPRIEPAPVEKPAQNATAPPLPPPASEDAPAPETSATLPPPPPGTVETDLDGVQFMLRDFRTATRENPVGSNAEITRALLGQNIKQVKLPVPEGSRLNENSELVDRWGTPYFFHQLSGTSMEVRSAGPDRTMWTRDDHVGK